MQDSVYNDIQAIASSETVELSLEFKNEINKSLALGHTRYMIRHGVLSDGHEKITDAQRYFQSIREMWNYANSMQTHKIQSMRAHAKLIDAKEAYDKAEKASDKLRAEADIMEAKMQLTASLVQTQDIARQLDELNKVRLELKPLVEAKYPGGIEEAEEDNWTAVYNYRMIKNKSSNNSERVDNICLSPEKKAELGYMSGRFDAIAPLMVKDVSQAKAIEKKVYDEVKKSQSRALEQHK